MSWVEKFVQLGSVATLAAKSEYDLAQASGAILRRDSLSSFTPIAPISPSNRMNLHVGVLHYTPSLEPFPLLSNPAG